MSRWKANFKSHQIVERVQNALTALDAIKVEGMAPDVIPEYARLLKVVKILAARLATLDPELYHQNHWQTCAQWAVNLQSQIAAYAQNRNVAHLQNANTFADDLLNTL